MIRLASAASVLGLCLTSPVFADPPPTPDEALASCTQSAGSWEATAGQTRLELLHTQAQVVSLKSQVTTLQKQIDVDKVIQNASPVSHPHVEAPTK